MPPRTVATIAIVSEDRILAALGRLANQMDDIASRLARMERRQELIVRAIERNTANDTLNTEAIMANFQPIYDSVEPLSDAIDSVSALVEGLAAQLVDASDDPEEILAIASTLTAEKDRLAALVVANTPAAPEPTEPPADAEPAPVDEG